MPAPTYKSTEVEVWTSYDDVSGLDVANVCLRENKVDIVVITRIVNGQRQVIPIDLRMVDHGGIY